MSRRLTAPLSALLSLAVAAFALGAGYQFGGGSIPYAPAVPDEMLYAAAAGLLGLGLFGILLRSPAKLGSIAPTVYVVVALLPLLRFSIPAISIIRFVPLALLAPAVYSLYRNAEPIPSHTRVARATAFAAFATAASSLIANRGDTDYLRLLLMVGGIILLVGAAPRAWSSTWRVWVERAVQIVFWAVVISSITLLPFGESFIGDRLRGAFISPNTLGALLALATPIAASRSRFLLVPWSSAFVIVILSGSRGGLLALSLAAIVILIRERRILTLAVFVASAILVLTAGVVRTQADQEETFGVNTRQLVWADVLDASLERPIAGHGFGAVGEIEFSAQTQRFAGTQPQTHSSWLDGLYEQGFLGLTFWIVLLLIGLKAAWSAGSVWFATLVAGVVSATFESWMFSIGGGLGSLFWLVFGAISLAVGGDSVEKRDASPVTGGSGDEQEIPEVSQPVSAPGEGAQR